MKRSSTDILACVGNGTQVAQMKRIYADDKEKKFNKYFVPLVYLVFYETSYPF